MFIELMGGGGVWSSGAGCYDHARPLARYHLRPVDAHGRTHYEVEGSHIHIPTFAN